MEILIYISLVISLCITIYLFFVETKVECRKNLKRIAIIFYVIFFCVSFLFGFIKNTSTKSNITVTNINIVKEEGKNAPFEMKWDLESEDATINKIFRLKLTVANHTDQDIKNLKLDFGDRGLKDYFLISQVTPAIDPRSSVFGLGVLRGQEKKEFIFELIPIKEGTYKGEPTPLIDDEVILTNKGIFKSEVSITTRGNN